MAAYKILISDGLDEFGKAVLRAAGDVADRDGISADNLLREIEDCDALIVRGRTKVTPAVFAAARQLKVVGRAGIGVDNIDLNAAKPPAWPAGQLAPRHHRYGSPSWPWRWRWRWCGNSPAPMPR